MKIIGSHNTSVTLRLNLDDVGPQGSFVGQQALTKIRTQFKLQQQPVRIPMGAVQMGAIGRVAVPFGTVGMPIGGQIMAAQVFRNGELTRADGSTVGINVLHIMPDFTLIAVGVNTTEDGDMVLDDICAILESDFNFHDTKTRTERNYGSGLIVEFEKPLEKYIATLAKMEEIINPVLKNTLNISQDIHLERLAFNFDPREVPASKVPFIGGFTIERRIDAPYSQNRFFCAAPLKSSDHKSVLENIEKAIQGSG